MWLVLLLLACADEPRIVDYDAACDTESDCVPVVDQGYCGACDGWGALSAAGAAAFEDDQARYADHHHCSGIILIYCVPDPDPPAVTCDGGRCALAP